MLIHLKCYKVLLRQTLPWREVVNRELAQASACAIPKKGFVYLLMSRKYKFHDNVFCHGRFVIKPEDGKYSTAVDFSGSDSYRMKRLVELNFSSE